MIVASTTKAFTIFGSGFVDLLRLSDGLKEGIWKGAGQDGLRAVAIFPFGKATQLLRSAKGLQIARGVANIRGPFCFWVASAKGLAHLEHRFKGQVFVAVEDVAKALGMSMESLWSIPSLSVGLSYLQRLGAQVSAISTVKSVKDLEKMVPRDGSIVMVGLHGFNNNRIINGHATYAFRNVLGKVRYMDRTVGKTVAREYKCIQEIAMKYRGVTDFVPYQAAIIKNVFAGQAWYDIPRLLIPVLGIIATQKDNQGE